MGAVDGGVERGRGLGPREGRGSAWEVERVEGGEEQCGRCNKMDKERRGVGGVRSLTCLGELELLLYIGYCCMTLKTDEHT